MKERWGVTCALTPRSYNASSSITRVRTGFARVVYTYVYVRKIRYSYSYVSNDFQYKTRIPLNY
jgi:hypothetical protein